MWKNVPWYEWYQANKKWEIRSLKKCRWVSKIILKTNINYKWYVQLGLQLNKKRQNVTVHKIIMLTFKWPRPKWMEINHDNWNKTNNNLLNLDYVTAWYNMEHSYKKLWRKPPYLWKFWKLHHGSKKVNQYTLDWIFIKTRDSIMDIQRKLKIFRQNISKCCNWKLKTAWWFIWNFS